MSSTTKWIIGIVVVVIIVLGLWWSGIFGGGAVAPTTSQSAAVVNTSANSGALADGVIDSDVAAIDAQISAIGTAMNVKSPTKAQEARLRQASKPSPQH